LSVNKTVEQFSDGNGNWQLHSALNLIPEHVIYQIHGCTPTAEHLGEDKPSWPYSSNGMFSVNTAYDFILNFNASGRAFWNNVRKREGPQKIKCFLWLVSNDGLKTSDKRSRCRLSSQSNCPLCLTETEKALHLLRECDLVMPVWQHFDFVFNLRVHDDVWNWLNTHLKPSNQKRHLLFGSIVWCIWLD
jgi:hypothetical protein